MPLCVHGDAVPCLSTREAGTQSFDVFSMEGLLSTGSTKTVKLFVRKMFEHNKSRTTTQVCVQCGRLFRGHCGRCMMGFGLLGPTQEAEFRLGTPKRTRTGTPLANGWFGTLRSMKGDLDHFANAFHLNLYGSATPCPYCPANADEHSDMVWNTFKADSPWKQLEHTAEEWHLLNPEPHPLLKLPYVSVDER